MKAVYEKENLSAMVMGQSCKWCGWKCPFGAGLGGCWSGVCKKMCVLGLYVCLQIIYLKQSCEARIIYFFQSAYNIFYKKKKKKKKKSRGADGTKYII